MKKNILTWSDVRVLTQKMAKRLGILHEDGSGKRWKVFGIPRGGSVVSVLLSSITGPHRVELVDSPFDADILVDDIVDSGATRDAYLNEDALVRGREESSSTILFESLLNKKESVLDGWYVFPWERDRGVTSAQVVETVEENIIRLIQYIGDDPLREGLRETPSRVVRSYATLFGGYNRSPSALLKTFVEDSCDEMVILKNIEFWSMCEHHMLPFFGTAHVAYIPDGRVVGVSKLARLVEVFSRRLQIQERLTEQVTEALDEYLKPKGSACVIESKHFCMIARGVQKQQSSMITSSLTGAFRQLEVRSEFLGMINA